MPAARSTFELDALIRAVAKTQLGLITVGQAAKSGVDKHALSRRRQAGALVAVFPGVLRLAPFALTPSQRILAASLAVPGSVVAGLSAATVHQMPIPPRLLSSDVTLTVSSGRRVRVPGIAVVRQTTQQPSVQWKTSRLATPASTLLLLPRYLEDPSVERCLDHALAHRLATRSSISALLKSTPASALYKRRLLLDLLADRSSGIGHRSANEQRVARWLRNARLTGWSQNFKVSVGGDEHDQEVEVDFAWERFRFALEVSPHFTHGSREKQERDAERRRLLLLNDWRVVEALDDDLANERAFGRIVATLRALGAS